jgi:IclR family acetate operon transcriptional repressor
MSAPEAWHVTRTLHALELLALRPRSAPELADALGVHVRTARRVIRRLEHEGYVCPSDTRGRRYGPTLRVVALAAKVVQSSRLTGAAVAHVEKLRGAVPGASCHLSVPCHLSALQLVHDDGGGATVSPQLEGLAPCHCTAAGKALLAWRPRWRAAVASEPLERFSARTLVHEADLDADLERTRSRGYAYEDREHRQGWRAVAAPVFSGDGEAVAALGLGATLAAFPRARRGELGAAVSLAAAELSRQLEARAA